MLLEGNRLKDNLYAAKYMMKPLGLRYQKTVMCLNFCMLNYSEYVSFIKCKTYQYAQYKTNNGK
jgi:hypothetical protein